MKKFILYAVALLLVLPASTVNVYSAEKTGAEDPSVYTKGYPKKIPEVLKSQFFCGYCHILTYPRVIKKAHNSWQAGKHKDVSCVDCHYPPGSVDVNIPEHENIPRDEKTASGKKTDMEYMKSELEVLTRLTTILNMDDSVIRTRPRIDDASCTIKCHLTTGVGKEGEFWEKKISFVESEREDRTKRVITYVHKTHFDKTKFVEGQEMHCTTCHQRETGKNHFEVDRQKCFLCHFKNAKLNEGRAKCSLCHKIPTKPLQQQKQEGANPDEKPITHQSVEEAGVKCASCHGHMIRGKGNVARQKCLTCHDNDEAITKEASNKKLMHQEHVAGQNAGCFDCHEPIEHNKEADYIDTARLECQACHPDHHKYQRMLLEGRKRPGVSNIPGLMDAVTTNCIACHIEEKFVNGEKVANGSGKACAACHTPKHEGMAKEWKEKTAKEAKSAWEIEKEAVAAIEDAKGKAAQEQIDEAMKNLEQGRESLNIVEYGGGVHNKKYSVMLIDVAMGKFEDAIDLLSEEEEEEEGEDLEVDCECVDGELDCADEDAKIAAEENDCECDDEGEVVCEDEDDEEDDEDEDDGEEDDEEK